MLIAGPATALLTDPAAGRHPGAAPVRDRCRAGRHVLSARPAHQAPAAAASRTAPGRASGPPPTPWSPSRSRSRRWPPTTPGTPAARAPPSPARWSATASTQVLCYVIGLLALVTVAQATRTTSTARSSRCRSASLGFAVLAARELDQSFADVYSTAVSIQNLRPLWDRRVLAGADRRAGHGGRAVAEHRRLRELPHPDRLGLRADDRRCCVVDYFVVSAGAGTCRRRPAPAWLMLLPWAAGFVTYQLINPGYVSWWASAWTSFGHDIGFTPASWMSASILSFAVAAAVTWRSARWPAGSDGDAPTSGRPRSGRREPERETRFVRKNDLEYIGGRVVLLPVAGSPGQPAFHGEMAHPEGPGSSSPAPVPAPRRLARHPAGPVRRTVRLRRG